MPRLRTILVEFVVLAVGYGALALVFLFLHAMGF